MAICSQGPAPPRRHAFDSRPVGFLEFQVENSTATEFCSQPGAAEVGGGGAWGCAGPYFLRHWASSKRELAHPDERLQLSRWLDETSRAQTRYGGPRSSHLCAAGSADRHTRTLLL